MSQRAWGWRAKSPPCPARPCPQHPCACADFQGTSPSEKPQMPWKGRGRRVPLLPGRHGAAPGARGSAAAAIIYQRCPVGRLKEKRPEGTGIAGFLVLLPKPSKLRFLPSTVTLRGLKFPPASAGALRGQTSPGAEEGTAK